jgi:sigma-B regulation protein RsbU (phosphoserine phosphatase)
LTVTARALFEKLRGRYFKRTLSALGIILLAGLLIEIVALVQYNYAHTLLEEELDNRTESEMTLKAVRVRGILRSHESMTRNYLWPVRQQIHHPDKIYPIIQRIVSTNPDVMSSFVAFVPDRYPDKGRLFEPSAYRSSGDSIIVRQLADPYDYTTREFYHEAVENGNSSWSDPYFDEFASGEQVVTYSMPLTDESGNVVAAFGIDMATQSIVDTLNMKHEEESTFFLLLTEDGCLVAQPDSTHAKWKDVDTVVSLINDSTVERKRSASRHSKVITFVDDEDGSKAYIYYAFMRGKPHWQVVKVCYDDEVYSKLTRMRRNSILMMLAGFSLLGFILYRYNRNLRNLYESNLSKEHTASELRVAQNIQSKMLPTHGIHRRDVDVNGMQVTAFEVGGDLYDYLIRDEKLYFCIGDVSGKGVPSSLVMAVVHSYFRTFSQNMSNPGQLMCSFNEAASQDNETNMFVTLFIGVLDLPTGRLRFCNAGHDAPLILEHGVKPLPVNANLPIGLYSDFAYVQQETVLPQDTTLLLYTDGLTEAANRQRQLFGLQRIIDAAQASVEQNRTEPDELMGALYDESVRFADGAQRSDDLTMLAIHYHRPDETLVLSESLTLANDVKQVPELNNFVKSVADRLNLEPSLSSQLMLAVEEAAVNVMNYAYPIGTEGNVQIDAMATEHDLKFIITDQGKAFDPTLRTHVDTTLDVEDRPIGGLGILLVQSMMDTINYERYDGKNVLTLKKEYKKR